MELMGIDTSPNGCGTGVAGTRIRKGWCHSALASQVLRGPSVNSDPQFKTTKRPTQGVDRFVVMELMGIEPTASRVRLGKYATIFGQLGDIFNIETSGSDAISKCYAMGKIVTCV